MFKPYQMFDGQDIDAIHEASLEVLEKIGLFVDHKGAQEKMAEAGAKVDAANNRIFITKELVENALKVGLSDDLIKELNEICVAADKELS